MDNELQELVEMLGEIVAAALIIALPFILAYIGLALGYY